LSEFVDLGKMKTPQNHVLANIVTSWWHVKHYDSNITTLSFLIL
jgi:hypothetical protein